MVSTLGRDVAVTLVLGLSHDTGIAPARVSAKLASRRGAASRSDSRVRVRTSRMVNAVTRATGPGQWHWHDAATVQAMSRPTATLRPLSTHCVARVRN